MRFHRLTCAALVAAMLALSVQFTQAYYDDTHYSLTYYIARSCGYTPLQAYRIASADVGIDYSPLTEPVQTDQFKGDWSRSPFVGLGVVASEFNVMHDPRVRFHAMTDDRLGPQGRVFGAIRGRALQLESHAVSQGNPGVLLHYLQDEDPHDGYTSTGGHWLPTPEDVTSGTRKPFGPTTDFLSHNQKKTLVMVDKTTGALSKFMRAMSPRQRVATAGCSATAMLSVLSSLTSANPVSPAAKDFDAQVQRILSEVRNLDLPARPAALLERTKALIKSLSAALDIGGPKTENADRVVAEALGVRELEAYPPAARRIRYEFASNGNNPLNELPPYGIYGTLTATVRGAEGRKVGISVWAAPTRLGEKAYQVSECQDSGYKFDKLPVGDLIVQSLVDGKVTRRNFRLERSQQALQIEIAAAKKDEPANKCQKEAAEIAAQACGAQKDANGDFTPNPNEDRLEQKLDECDEEEDKKNTEEENTPNTQTPSQVTPPPSGPSMGKIIGWTTLLTGSIVGGAYVYEQAQLLAEETGSTNTNTNTNTGNPTPTSNTPSTVGLGTFSCSAANSTSNLRSCTGAINVRAGTLLGARAGTSIGVQTTPSFFVGTMTAPSLGGTTGTVTLRTTLSSCPTQTFVNFSLVGAQPFESVPVSIPVSCP